MIIPEVLKKGDKVIIVSPSGCVEKDVIDLACNYLTEWGLIVEVSPHARGRHHQFSGTVDERRNDIQEAFDNPDIKAIFCSRGGYGSVQYVEDLSLKGISANPKWLIGFSDISILHSLLNRNNLASLHGPMPKNFDNLLKAKNDKSLQILHDFLFTGDYNVSFESKAEHEDFTVSGEIIGGNLSVLAAIRGTLFEPYYDGKILLLEDLGEYVYHIDRLLHNFKLASIFKRVSAVICGGFTNMKDGDPSFGKTINEVIDEALKNTGTPVVKGFPAGHQIPNYPIPLGLQCRLTQRGRQVNLSKI